MSFGLTDYGRREWLGATVAAAALCAGLVALALLAAWPWALGLAPVAAVWAWVLWFFRDPRRDAPGEDGAFLSPADGRVAEVAAVGPDSALGREGLRVGVFMNIFDVHVNRSPCEARVAGLEHRDGAFLDARDGDAAWRNECTTIRLTHRRGGRDWPVVVRQVAGMIARRIVTDLSVGQAVRTGQRIGMIKFGSYVELLVPRELARQVRVAVGQKVTAGRTVLLAAAAESEHGAT